MYNVSNNHKLHSMFVFSCSDSAITTDRQYTLYAILTKYNTIISTLPFNGYHINLTTKIELNSTDKSGFSYYTQKRFCNITVVLVVV